jgi:hypothetical protein
MLQIDALSYAELRRGIELGHCPTISKMVREEGYTMRRWFCGLPSATPYCQAGIFHGENEGIPAFRFYDKVERRVITCNTPSGVQYIRDRIHAPGALAGGSSYVNLLDGDAQTVALTVATRERMSVFQRLGGWRMAMLLVLHPIRLLRMGLQAVLEWLREEYERAVGELARRRTHSEGLFPFIRVLTTSLFAKCRRWRFARRLPRCSHHLQHVHAVRQLVTISGVERRLARSGAPTRASARFVA